MSDDARWLAAAASIAARARPLSRPNPAVGAIIVKDGKVVGHGWTQPGGRPHAEALALQAAGEAARGADYQYTFEGRRSFTGITVRRDPSRQFIWIATILLLAGLCTTFFLPRRQIWVRITGGRLQLAGLAPRGSEFGEELQRLVQESTAPPGMNPAR